MDKYNKALFKILYTIEGAGTFISTGQSDFVFPGLQVEGIGEIAFPVNEIQGKALVERASRAPFGKGSETIEDTTVRNTWEIDAKDLSFHNSAWKVFMKKTLKKVKEDLGLEDRSIKASLYKLLIYEKGGFFLPHKDSEKEKGMFGSLVIGLPSPHKGGKLHVRFDGKKKKVDFSKAASKYTIPHAAFYADCEHEIKPVTAGYRVCLVYNLIQTKGKKGIGSPQFHDQIDQMAQLLKEELMLGVNEPTAILLNHQYTPTNFSVESLKLRDRPWATTLMQAAEKAGFHAKLGLLTAYSQGAF